MRLRVCFVCSLLQKSELICLQKAGVFTTVCFFVDLMRSMRPQRQRSHRSSKAKVGKPHFHFYDCGWLLVSTDFCFDTTYTKYTVGFFFGVEGDSKHSMRWFASCVDSHTAWLWSNPFSGIFFFIFYRWQQTSFAIDKHFFGYSEWILSTTQPIHTF